MSFERIYTHVCDKAPQLAPRNTHAVREWLAAGYDVEKDIIPAIDAVLKRGGRTIFSWGFFTHAIQSHHEKRVKEQRNEQKPQSEKDAIRAKNVQWLIEKGLAGIQDIEWFNNYREGNISAIGR